MRQVWCLAIIGTALTIWGAVALAGAPSGPSHGTDDFEPIPFQWIEINPNLPGGLPGTQILFLGGSYAGPFHLGFDFPFYDCGAFNETYVYVNGLTSFTSVAGGTYANSPIPSSYEPNNMLAIYWDDFYLDPLTSVWCYQDSANHRFIIEWYQLQHITGGGTYTFESILYTDGAIEYSYHTIEDDPPNSCTVGIESITGTEGIQATYNGSGPFEPASGTAIRFNSECVKPVDDLMISLGGTGFHDVILVWSSISDAQQYHIYKSDVPVGGFTLLDSTTDTTIPIPMPSSMKQQASTM